MAFIFRASNWVADTQLTDFTAAPADGADWSPHPDYVGTLRGGAVGTNRVFSNPADTDEALYVNDAPEASSFTVDMAFGRYGSGAIDNTIGFCYFVQMGGKSFYRLRYNGTDWLLEKVIAGVATTLATVATPDLSTSVGVEHIVTMYVSGGLHVAAIIDDTGSAARTVIAALDTTITSGRFGLWGSCNGAVTGTAPSITPTNGVYIGYHSTVTNDLFFGIGNPSITPSPLIFTVASTVLSVPPGVGALALPQFVVRTDITPVNPVSIAITLPQFTASGKSLGIGAGIITLPQFTVLGKVDDVPAYSEIRVTAPMPSSFIVGGLGGLGTLSAVAPRATSRFVGGIQWINARAPMARASIVGLTAIVGTISATAPRVTGAFTAVLSGVGTIVARAPRAAAVLTAIQSIVGSINARAPRAKSFITSYVTVTGTIVTTAPMPTSDLVGGLGIVGTIVFTAPRAKAYLTTNQTLDTLVNSIVVNSVTSAVSEFQNYAFDSFAIINNTYYAAGVDGVYELDSSGTDQGAPIYAYFETGAIDFRSEYLKRMETFYAAYRTTGDILVSVKTDEGKSYTYSMKYDGTPTIKQRRVPIGKGLKGKYWQFKVENVAGSGFGFDTFNILAHETVRRIGV